MSSETFYNITKAAQLCGVTNPTIRKALKEGKFPNATEGKQGNRKTISIPFSDLQTSGYLDKVNSSQAAPTNQPDNSSSLSSVERDELITLRERVRQLEQQLSDCKQREVNFFGKFLELETLEQQSKRRKFWSFGK